MIYLFEQSREHGHRFNPKHGHRLTAQEIGLCFCMVLLLFLF